MGINHLVINAMGCSHHRTMCHLFSIVDRIKLKPWWIVYGHATMEHFGDASGCRTNFPPLKRSTRPVTKYVAPLIRLKGSQRVSMAEGHVLSEPLTRSERTQKLNFSQSVGKRRAFTDRIHAIDDIRCSKVTPPDIHLKQECIKNITETIKIHPSQ